MLIDLCSHLSMELCLCLRIDSLLLGKIKIRHLSKVSIGPAKYVSRLGHGMLGKEMIGLVNRSAHAYERCK